MDWQELTPRQIVAELDKYIVGQERAKRIVAIALRNRYRRKLLPENLRDEVAPKNILMIGPTGVGKTEIARRLARLVKAPFVKVEATKFTEVGYVGRDVDGMVRDLVDAAVRMVEQEKIAEVEYQAEELANQRLIEALGLVPPTRRRRRSPIPFPFAVREDTEPAEPDEGSEDRERIERLRRHYLLRMKAGEFDDEEVEIEVEEQTPPFFVNVLGPQGMEQVGFDPADLLGSLFPKRKRKRRMKVKDARRVLMQEEAQKLIDRDEVVREAIRRAEEDGIIFIDEMDKIAGRERGIGPDVSREGVQRDLLPIVEGSTVMTRYGAVHTHHILFIAAGAFHVTKPSDLIPELQGRFPLRVELDPLGKDDFKRILTEPENALIKQYTALLATEGVTLHFTEDAIDAIAHYAQKVNEETENIGARRLHTIIEKVLEDISFRAPELTGETVIVDADYVRRQLEGIIENRDLSRYIL
ncbi:ATP-dependent protease ATPase subunit ClpY [bacterium HR17]|jgi:ATP-dependent HslUV protease ATP-binding subunit HslU|uniref:ATP-dependent protease ATPase subunit HslU n=1 Tax=Candidatus Fervidibacter japonicus TaxID=2035412 RepID=A0A2H5XED9_9BACT|nr:ATP-dependent protease ATPase subunit ClpY [bacterium HR17]